MDQPPQTPPPDPPPAEPTKPADSTRDELGHFRPGVVQPGAKPFKPGQSGNQGGSSKNQRFTSALRRLLDSKEGLDDALMNKALSMALKGDFRFWKELYDRIEGTVAQRIAGPDGGPVKQEGMSQVQINMLMTDPVASEAAWILAVKMAELEDRELGNGNEPPEPPLPREDEASEGGRVGV